MNLEHVSLELKEAEKHIWYALTAIGTSSKDYDILRELQVMISGYIRNYEGFEKKE